MKHYLITNREILEDSTGKEYIREDGAETARENLRFAIFDSDNYRTGRRNNNFQIKQSIELIEELKPAAYQKSSDDVLVAFKNPYSRSMTNKAPSELMGSARVFTDLYQKLTSPTESGDILLFIHGFNNTLETALDTLCTLEEKYVSDPESPIKHLVMFTWPARGNLLRYRDDARDAELSGYALGRAYQILLDFLRTIFGPRPDAPKVKECGCSIHMMVHSMGNRVLENMLLKLISERSPVTAFFKEIILTGADVDWSVFEDTRAFYRLTEICQRVTVYYHQKDIALFISESTKNSYNRLGKYGFRDYNKVPAHLYSIDCSDIDDEAGVKNKVVHHWYYIESKKVIADMIKVLRGHRVEEFASERVTVNEKQYRIKV